MVKVNMKETEYYKSGNLRFNVLNSLIKARKSYFVNNQIKIEIYYLGPRICEAINCNNPLAYNKRCNRYCSKSCAAITNNTGRLHSKESNSKTSISVKSAHLSKIKIEKDITKEIEDYYESPKLCQICEKIIPYENRHNTKCLSIECDKECRRRNGQKGGLKAASSLKAKRSKNEIAFHDLCKLEFNHVTNNDPIFDGWDADVLIHDHKIAVLWNGPWHYQEMGCYNHSLKQVQNRDQYKAKLIAKHGWILYIIKDTTEAPTKPSDAIITLKDWMDRNLVLVLGTAPS